MLTWPSRPDTPAQRERDDSSRGGRSHKRDYVMVRRPLHALAVHCEYLVPRQNCPVLIRRSSVHYVPNRHLTRRGGGIGDQYLEVSRY